MTENHESENQTNPVVNPAVDPSIRSEVGAKTPEWVKDAIFYQIFPDRFARSSRVPKPSNIESWDTPPTTYGYKAGDLLGIAENIDYLADLGITALYLNPIFASAANHRYHTHDYFEVDPILGGQPALRKLLDVAHTRGIRVILDGVFNHASRGFYQFNHALENGAASPYIDWFYYHGFPVQAYGSDQPNYAAWWGLPALPKFNTNTPAVREFLWSVASYWLELGIDGWRLDVPEEINDDEFWREFRRRVKTVNPEAYICGEIWTDARRWLQGDQFDSVMNYLFTRACLSFFVRQLDMSTIQGTGYAGRVNTGLDAHSFAATINELLAMYPTEITAAQLNLLDSHDTARFLTSAQEDESALRLATLFQMCYPGAPCVYYGDEIGLSGGKDPANRGSFPWDRSKWNEPLLGFFKRAIELRREYAALRRGSFDPLVAQNKLFVFGRANAEEKLIIALNAGETTEKLPALPGSTYLPEGSILLEQLSTTNSSERQVFRIGPGGVIENFSLPPRTGIALEVVKLAR
ncbi:MAG TPA: glycoside hydrolase family 13 protein [Chloroflexia bacterium]|nr:glycoside hydrolase family 13 protein [Chloroflexia bacterium]